MSKPPPPDSPLTRPQKIAKLEGMYLHRFVETPLSFWDDGSTVGFTIMVRSVTLDPTVDR